MNKKFTLGAVASIFLIGITWLGLQKQDSALELPQNQPLDIDFLEAKSSIGSKEDPIARFNYEAKMVVDPKTGKLPKDIRAKELNFVQQIPKRAEKGNFERGEVETWEQMGPFNFGGRTRALAIDATDDERILAGGVSGGVWKSENGGSNWEKTTTPLSLHSITCLAQDTRTGKQNTWYYGTGELRGNTARSGSATLRGDGVFKSIDGGNSWTLLPTTAEGTANFFDNQFNYIWNIVTNPFNQAQDEVLIAAFGGILRSVDGGATWSLVLGDGFENRSSFFTNITITSDGTYYATLSEEAIEGQPAFKGVFRSEDGVSWTNITPGNWPREYSRVVLGAAPSNPNVLYFIADSEPITLWKYTYVSGNGSGSGGQWENRSTSIPAFGEPVGDYDLQASYNMVIQVHPQDENMVYLGGTNLYRSSDGFATGNNTTWIGGYMASNEISPYENHFPDQHAVVFFNDNPNEMLSAHDGGISKTNSNLANEVFWTALNNGYVTSQFYTLALDPAAESNAAIGGLQDNGSLFGLMNGSTSNWGRVLGGDGAYCAITDEAIYYYFSFQNGETYRVTLNDEPRLTSFARVDPSGGGLVQDQEYLFVNPFVLDPNNNNRMYIAGGDVVWRNHNLGQVPVNSQDPTPVNWTKLVNTKIDSGQISAINVSRAPGDVLYYGNTEGQVFRVDEAFNSSSTMQRLTHPNFPIDAYVSCIAIDPTNADHVVVVFSNYNVISVFASTDGGDTFESISGNLEENPDGTGEGPSVRWIEIVPQDDGSNYYFAGTSTGLFSTESLAGDNTEWLREGAESIGNVVVPMVRYKWADGTVAAATHGNGIYATEFPNVTALPRETGDLQLQLGKNYPNPFDGSSTTIKFNIPTSGGARVRIYDLNGKIVKTILFAQQFAGENEITWNGTNENGVPVPSGTYIYRLEHGTDKIAKKLILAR